MAQSQSSSSKSSEFPFIDKLPFKSEIATMIYQKVPVQKETSEQTTAITHMAKQLIQLWTKAFGSEHLKSKSTVTRNIRTLVREHRKVICNSKYKRTVSSKQKTVRTAEDEWLKSNTTMFSLLKASVDPEKFDEDEKIFFHNQCKPDRPGYISKLVDDKYLKNLNDASMTEDESAKSTEEEDEYETNFDDCLSTSLVHSSSIDSLNLTRSGTVRYIEEPAQSTPKPKCRNSRRIINEGAKCTIARISTVAEVSIEKARLLNLFSFFQLILKHFSHLLALLSPLPSLLAPLPFTSPLATLFFLPH